MIGKTIRKHRREIEMSQAELARKVGVSRQMINLIENGKANPSMKLLNKLSKELDFPMGRDNSLDKLHEILREIQSQLPTDTKQ